MWSLEQAASALTDDAVFQAWARGKPPAAPVLGANEQGPGPETSSKPKVRPIQKGEFLWKFNCKRILTVEKADCAAITASMRQFGGGISGGAEELIHSLKIVSEMSKQGS